MNGAYNAHMTSQDLSSNIASLHFDNRFTRDLPADPVTTNHTRQVHRACFSRVQPTQVAAPQLVAFSREMAERIGLSEQAARSPEFAQVFAGNRLLPGMDPFAMCYGGHQFGNWAGQLGDGRAINLGEVLTSGGEHWTLQLKGAGKTPYSRHADGLAVLRSSVREFLCSEAMHHLGVPTTRALSLVLTGEKVMRDMFYDGNPQWEPGAIVCRMAPSFIRFGNFQIFAARKDVETLRQLVDFTIRTDFPHLGDPSSPAVLAAWFEEICRTTVDMILHWMRVGFVHGVMNTDNMSILGLTIDYGPYGWLEDFDPGWTPNTTDAQGRRYCFGNQPQIALWNLSQLGNALVPIFGDPEPLNRGLELYSRRFNEGWRSLSVQKLGLKEYLPETDLELTNDLHELLPLVETDMTIFYRRLADLPMLGDASQTEDALFAGLADAYYVPDQLTPEYRQRMATWLGQYRARLQQQGESDAARRERMNGVNPKYVLRNYLAQLAIDKAEQGDFSLVEELLEVLRRPYDEQPDKERFAEKRPDWARSRAGCSMLSCSS